MLVFLVGLCVDRLTNGPAALPVRPEQPTMPVRAADDGDDVTGKASAPAQAQASAQGRVL